MVDHRGERYSSYGGKIPGILKKINDGIAYWMLCRGNSATPYK